MQAEVVSLKFVRPDVAIAETLQTVMGFQRLQKLFRGGLNADDNGQLRTRLLQVMAKDGGEWKVVTYHNVDVKEQK
jgi:hypothetical protein